MSAAVALSHGQAHAEKWDMPMAYAATNFHSEHGVLAEKVKKYTNGALEITTHPVVTLKVVKSSVQCKQVKPLLASVLCLLMLMRRLCWDGIIFRFLPLPGEANDKLWLLQRQSECTACRSKSCCIIYPSLARSGLLFQKVNSSADTQGIKFRSYNSATATFAKERGMLPFAEAAELSQALATGVAEAFISSGSHRI